MDWRELWVFDAFFVYRLFSLHHLRLLCKCLIHTSLTVIKCFRNHGDRSASGSPLRCITVCYAQVATPKASPAVRLEALPQYQIQGEFCSLQESEGGFNRWVLLRKAQPSVSALALPCFSPTLVTHLCSHPGWYLNLMCVWLCCGL